MDIVVYLRVFPPEETQGVRLDIGINIADAVTVCGVQTIIYLEPPIWFMINVPLMPYFLRQMINVNEAAVLTEHVSSSLGIEETVFSLSSLASIRSETLQMPLEGEL